ncbi:MAG: IPT/TIG domain-containing protein [Acidobacteriota bacterium]|nr:IPT/TIG domain-containing protein [Acidobacteriota bacterium]
MRWFLLVVSLATAASSFAQLQILSVSPSTVPTSGGTIVTLEVNHASDTCGPINCPVPTVYFGGVAAAETHILNATTVTARTPPMLPGTAAVTYKQGHEEATWSRPFTITGPVPPAYERILVPILVPPVHGAFGSKFHTELHLGSKRAGYLLYGLDLLTCPIPEQTVCEPIPSPFTIPGGAQLASFEHVQMNGRPGRFIYVAKDSANDVAGNLRVFDVTRAALNFGTEIPLVRGRDFDPVQLTLYGVPADPRFRNTLRIYGVEAIAVKVTVEGHAPVEVVLHGGDSLYEPAYGEFTNFPATGGPFRVTIEPPPPTGGVSPPIEYPVWAFITVTNNETQVISTITPQP